MNAFGYKYITNQLVRAGGCKNKDWNKNLWRLAEAYSKGVDEYNQTLLDMHDEAGHSAAMTIHQ